MFLMGQTPDEERMVVEGKYIYVIKRMIRLEHRCLGVCDKEPSESSSGSFIPDVVRIISVALTLIRSIIQPVTA